VPALAAMAVLLSGCPAPATRTPLSNAPGDAPQPDLSASPILPPPASTAQRPPQPPRENHLSPATRSLVTQARTLMSRGDLDGASSTLDRALRIEPNSPLLWIERGRLRLAQAGRLLADALRAQQRNPEARAVESQPYMRQ
jgi:hypothetical protein